MLPKPAEAPTEHPPVAGGLPFWQWLYYRVMWFLLAPIYWLIFRIRTRGTAGLPRSQPYLLLANHTSLLDPFWVAFPLWRPLRFMASANTLAIPVLGPLLRGLGAFPKMKFVKDRGSMEQLAAHYAQGLPVVIFPEGERCWDGTPLPVLPGIGRLIHRLGGPVVFARLDSAHLMHPRWAKTLRYIPLEITYEGPITYPPDLTPEAITADVARRILTPPRRDPAAWSWGWRLAAGLPSYLWACPACFSVESLEVPPRDQDRVRCRSCAATWRIDLDTRMNGEGDAPSFTVAEAYALLAARFGQPPVQDRARFEADGTVMTGQARVIDLPQAKGAPPVAEGPMRLSAEALEVGPWRLPLAALRAISIELADRVYLRTVQGQVLLDPAGGSGMRLCHFLRAWAPDTAGKPGHAEHALPTDDEAATADRAASRAGPASGGPAEVQEA